MTDFLGVDPGKYGGIAVLKDTGVIVTPMIIAGKDLDLVAISEWIDWNVGTDVIACIEKVSAMPGQGVVSMFSFGFTTGAIYGILATFGISIHVVTPQEWKKRVLAGTRKDKNAAIDYCRRVYPDVSLLATRHSTKPHTGIADSICIAEYASLTYRIHSDIRSEQSDTVGAGVATRK